MARRSKDGAYIISAGEVGSYTVCPEAWRLQMIDGVTHSASGDQITRGAELHQSWASGFSEAVYLHRTIRLILLLVLLAILIVLLKGA